MIYLTTLKGFKQNCTQFSACIILDDALFIKFPSCDPSHVEYFYELRSYIHVHCTYKQSGKLCGSGLGGFIRSPYGKKCTAANNFREQLANTLRLFGKHNLIWLTSIGGMFPRCSLFTCKLGLPRIL